MAKTEQIEQLAGKILHRHGCDLVLLTFRREPAGRVLRLLIEKSGADPDQGSGVDHTLCSAVSRELGAILEDDDAIIDGKFVLEVSSPGIERPLVKLEDFDRFTGRAATIKVREAIGGKRKFKGVLKGTVDDTVRVDTGRDEDVVIPFNNIDSAKLVFEPKRF